MQKNAKYWFFLSDDPNVLVATEHLSYNFIELNNLSKKYNFYRRKDKKITERKEKF
jgi:hypothetical protein